MTDFSIYLDSDIVPAKDTITNDELATLLSGGVSYIPLLYTQKN